MIVEDLLKLETTETPTETTETYLEQYANDPNMKLVGEDVQSDEEHKVLTIRSGNEYIKTKVKRNT